MSFSYRNPILGDTQTSPKTPTSDDRTYGLNFSVYNIGGYMEVDTLSDLGYSSNSATGNINYSGNTIPVNFYVSPNALPSKVFLWPDKISSGRRRLGMLVYVRENDTTYQYRIPDYNTLYNNADTAGVIVYDGQTYYEVRNKSGITANSAGQALLDAWTGSTIEGQSGVTRENANWIKYHASAPEYISINAVPASANFETWLTSNSISDAFITIPSKWHGKEVINVNATFGGTGSNSNSTFKLEMRDATNTVDSSVSWTHSANNRAHSTTFSPPLTLVSGYTLNIGITTNPSSNATGYSATFEIEG